MKVDAFVAEIGSTTTILNAFDNLDSDNPVFLGSGYAPTSVLEGDVLIGLEAAKADLMNKLNTDELDNNTVLKDINGNIAKWGLTKVEDIHGNNICYNMTLHQANQAHPGKETPERRTGL